jgi:chaperonin cofactor prefoldin
MATAQRKLIQTAELHIEVDSYATARRALDKQLKDLGGYVANAEVQHNDGEVSSATLTLRIPSDKLGELVSDAAGYGTVTQEKLDTQDVSDAYYDLSARLRNAKRLEARLLELLAGKTDGIKGLLEVERELARVREQVERMEGQLKRYDQQVSMSTVQLQLSTRRVYAAAAKPSFGEHIANTFGGSLSALKIAGYAVVLFAVALVPWLLPILLAFFGIRALMRRQRGRRANQTPRGPQPVPVQHPPYPTVG